MDDRFRWDDNESDAPVHAGWIFGPSDEVDERAVGFWLEYAAEVEDRRGAHWRTLPDGATTTYCSVRSRCAECDPGRILWSYYGDAAPAQSGWAETVAEARAILEDLAGAFGRVGPVHYHLDGLTRAECPKCESGLPEALDVLASDAGSAAVYLAGVLALVVVPVLAFVVRVFGEVGGALS